MSADIKEVAPTFHGLNKVQKRALVLRDNLRWLDPRHLDTFFEGLSEYEPPAYKRINGTVVPPLVMITLKEHASRFDLGNVEFVPRDKPIVPGVYHAFLTVENGAFEMRREEGMPQHDAVLETLPIHSFIAKDMKPLFEIKFKAIWARMKQINEMRQVAYNMVENEPVDDFVLGETLTIFDTEPPTRNGQSSKAHRKRRPNSPIPQHVSNKRTHIGLATIPASSKAKIFNAIPNAIKVDLFNNVVNTAFPNFDNLMMAAWNVVSVYSNVGTDFPELHNSIVELKSVLQDFEEGSGKTVVRGAPEFRSDFAPEESEKEKDHKQKKEKEKQRKVRGEQGMPDAPQDGDGAAGNGGEEEDAHTQQPNDYDVLFNDPEPEPEQELPAIEMPPPRTPHRQKKKKIEEEVQTDSHRQKKKKKLDDQASRDPRCTASVRGSPSLLHAPSQDPCVSARLRTPSQEPRSSPAPRHRSAYDSSPLFTSPAPAHDDDGGPVQSPYTANPDATLSPFPTNPTDPTDEHRKSLANLSYPQLRHLYKTRKEELLTQFNGNRNVPAQYRDQMLKLKHEIRERESERVEREEEELERERREEQLREDEDNRGDDEVGNDEGRGEKVGKKEKEKDGGGGGAMLTFLGNSVLSGKKNPTMCMAPVAPMVHTKKNAGVGGLGGVKRKFDREE